MNTPGTAIPFNRNAPIASLNRKTRRSNKLPLMLWQIIEEATGKVMAVSTFVACSSWLSMRAPRGRNKNKNKSKYIMKPLDMRDPDAFSVPKVQEENNDNSKMPVV